MSVEDKKIAGWAIWYIDEMYSSKDTKFEDLPRDGALCMITFETRLKPDGNHIKNMYQGYDYYFRADGKRDFLYACDLDSRERATQSDIKKRYDNPIIIRGKWTDRETLQVALDEAQEWQL